METPQITIHDAITGETIVRDMTADASGKTITGGTATTSGIYTVRTFTASGSLVIA